MTLIVVALAGVTGRPFSTAVRPLLPPSSSSSTSPLLRNAHCALAHCFARLSISLCPLLSLLRCSLSAFARFSCYSPFSLTPLSAACAPCHIPPRALSFPSPPLRFVRFSPCLRLRNALRKFCFLPRGRLEAADTHPGIPHEAEACTVGWLEKPTCLECLGPAVPPPLPQDLQHR